MLLFVLISLLGLPPAQSAATPPSLQIMEGASLIPPRSQNSSTATTNTPTNISSSIPRDNIDPRFTYEKYIADSSLDKSSAYLNTLLALEDLSTKGWTSTLSYGKIYTFTGYGGVTVRASASLNPSNLQYRHAIWGLYFAIREASSHDFRACVLTLYWSPIKGKSRHVIGYVSILSPATLSINAGNPTDDTLENTTPSPPISLPNLIENDDNSTSFTIAPVDQTGLGFRIEFGDRRIDIDSVFQTVYAGVVYLASFPQSQAITQPGLIKGDVDTFLRWDSVAIQAWPSFEYRYALAALSTMAVCMYERARFWEVRLFTYIDENEVGVSWLYTNRIGGDSDEK